MQFRTYAQVEAAPSTDQGNVLLLKGEYEESIAGFSALGLKGKPAEQVAEEVCRDWLHFDRSNGTVDKHLADQKEEFTDDTHP